MQLAASSDGSSWTQLERTAVGADSIVEAMYSLKQNLVALTVKGKVEEGAVPGEPVFGLSTQPPLRAWTSPDSVNWTLAAEPLNLSVVPGGGLDQVFSAATGSHILVAYKEGPRVLVAETSDGATWSAFEPIGLPEGFDLRTLAALPSGFVMTGNTGLGDMTGGAAAWSADGHRWEVASFPAPALAPDILAAGSQGLLLSTQVPTTPGGPTWWASSDGQEWQKVEAFAPLGIWQGPGEGAGLEPQGEVSGDGSRIVAYDTFTGARGWTSFDGQTWSELAVSGDRPLSPQFAAILVEPGGLVLSDSDRVWFGDPGP